MKPCAGCPCLVVRKIDNRVEAKCMAKSGPKHTGRMVCWQFGSNRDLAWYTVWGILHMTPAPKWCPNQNKEDIKDGKADEYRRPDPEHFENDGPGLPG